LIVKNLSKIIVNLMNWRMRAMDDENKVTRRNFLGILTASIGGIIAAALGIPAIAYIIGPALKREELNWIRLGAVSKVEVSSPTLFKTTLKQQTGWVTSEEELSIYVLTEDGRDFIAMSNVCTHLGCRVRWVSDQGLFMCPCHNGAFNKDGSIAYGPPPRPLDRYEVKNEENEVFVLGGQL
jgi:menaquinol-cytochrome c reductase iron-sulfur subunit